MQPPSSASTSVAPDHGSVAPVITRAPPADRKFPCQKCGARLDFDPASHSLKCPYCGFTELIEPSTKAIRERDWDEYWRNSSGAEATLAGRSCQVTCSVCGAVVLLEDKVAADHCPYCGTFLQNQPEAATAMIPPEGILPFAITELQANSAFNQWIASRWFAPNQLYQFANLGRLSGIYVPHWTYDSMTFTHYTGQRGDDYTTTETYTEHDASGNAVTKTRNVTHTNWTPVSGQIRHFFDDVLVCASHSVPVDLMTKTAPWDLPHLEDFKPEFLAGFQAERYAVGLREGFEKARHLMDAQVRRLCEQAIGGNHQRLDSVQTQYLGITFKHLLLPSWLAAYRYYDRTYRILINGRTGKVAGTRPYSLIKITLFVLVMAALLIGFLLLSQSRAFGATSADANPHHHANRSGSVSVAGGAQPKLMDLPSAVPREFSRGPSGVLATSSPSYKRVPIHDEGRYRVAG